MSDDLPFLRVSSDLSFAHRELENVHMDDLEALMDGVVQEMQLTLRGVVYWTMHETDGLTTDLSVVVVLAPESASEDIIQDVLHRQTREALEFVHVKA